MTPQPMTVSSAATVREAVDLLRDMDVRHLPVVNENRELIGMVSDRDLRGLPYAEPGADEVLRSPADLDASVSTIMSADVISVDLDADASEVVELMLENKIGAVPVVGPDGGVMGIVSYIDVLRHLSVALAEEEGAAAPTP